MRALWKLTVTEVKLYLRDPIAAFFTVAWPVILLLVNNASGDNAPVADLGGQRPIDMSVAVLTGMVLGILGIIAVPVGVAYNRERGILRRMAATPVPPAFLLTAQLLAYLLIGTIALGTTMGVAVAALGANLPAQPATFASVYLLGALALFGVGFVLAAVAPSYRAANAVGLGVFFPLLFLSGTMMPREVLPDTLARIGDFTPMSWVTRSLRDAYAGDGVTWVLVAAMAALVVVGTGLATRWFRWD
jgi:ABC-2 type transport system permease protein